MCSHGVVTRVAERAEHGTLQRARIGEKGQGGVGMRRYDNPSKMDTLIIVRL